MKKWMIGMLSVVVIAGYIMFSEMLKEENTSDLAVTESFRHIDDLATSSPIVIVGKVSSAPKPFTHQSVTFFESHIQVQRVYRDVNGQLKSADTITLLQNDMEEDPLVKRDETVLLYLQRYEGPVMENAYRIVGLQLGHFRVNRTGTLTSVGKPNLYQESGLSADLSKLETSLKDNPYVEERNEVMTDEEIRAFNENEVRLFEESQQHDE
ncbi:hypothetical protein IR194_01445 [Exiguobacterium sp. PBE]|uniref:hypothetical protein n=1 Tax=unclassified Exiguobacterium TaxID=2644629 RepID=UPI0018C364CA|nr:MULTISPECIES: hypothetical protein [unclassified Exiguobacterium]MBG0918206.1 hypothetical protein [Exiguobacterium sp. SRB7LM]QPI67969.1 hypothetical protein IR194_01445 [Exiguobacterium sp. PBE]